MFSLLHLGATKFNHDPLGKIFEKEKDFIHQTEKIIVLGNHAPALTFAGLRVLEKQE
jgi:hypothetical protein